MKLTVRTPQGRNPFVALARLRKAGSHRASGKSTRQAARQALRQQLHRGLDLHSP